MFQSNILVTSSGSKGKASKQRPKLHTAYFSNLFIILVPHELSSFFVYFKLSSLSTFALKSLNIIVTYLWKSSYTFSTSS
jgi:hypothetical protein